MKKLTTEIFIAKAKIIHGNTYGYALVEYVNSQKHIRIKCNIHGEFSQSPTNHLQGNGCPLCAVKNKELGFHEFVLKANTKHNFKYTYIEDSFTYFSEKVQIMCPKHGVFSQRATSHIRGTGCKKCAEDRRKNNKIMFIEKANKIHKGKYDYDLVEYSGSREKIKIKCPKHGYFNQTVYSHLSGSGCPRCKFSKGESKISTFLTNKNIIFIPQKRFSDCRGYRYRLPFDFYLPSYNLIIEYHGIQHFKSVKLWGGLKKLYHIQKIDKLKKEYCMNKGIIYLEINYKTKNIEEFLNNYLLNFPSLSN